MTNESIFRKLYANESLIMACLEIYQKLLSLVTFLRVYSNSKEISYLPWQNTYPNLKTTCHIKLKFFLQTKLRELTPCKISHICHCAFKVIELQYIALFVVIVSVIVPLFNFSQYFFSRLFCPVEKCGVTPHCLYCESLVDFKNFFKQTNPFQNIYSWPNNLI